MPIHRRDTVTRDNSNGANNPCGRYSTLKFSDDDGLTQFGAFVEILPPGSKSSIKHWHSEEDEMVYVLEGEVLLHEGDSRTPLRPGEAATFKAGVALGHCIENMSNQDAQYLVIGTRAAADTVTYPDDDRQIAFDRRSETRAWTDHAGKPATNPCKLD